MSWRTTETANEDLERIGEDGALVFGRDHARNYTLQLLDMFDMLAAHPEAAPERQAAHQVIRLMPCGSHHILYIVEDEGIVILRVLHGLQNWFELL